MGEKLFAFLGLVRACAAETEQAHDSRDDNRSVTVQVAYSLNNRDRTQLLT